ncbi:septum formation family protein [Nocardioides zeae]|uniref:Septum formation-related domain-containing protein n=1 Tax=Nocardioides zeae TaxID=1457234 RepID=A0AAJ1TWA0_9ACTN|nr:septum formation family protein [Nocardioides zeae]MDQ1103456.1 hypothetical protein [Nocardioides zeae]
MTRSRLRHPAATTAATAVVLALTTALAGCSGGSDDDATATPSTSATPTATPTTAAPAERPAAGACYDLGFEEALAPTTTSEAVDCAADHTAQTYAVGQLATYADGHLLAVDDPAVQAGLGATCRSSLAEYVGGDTDALRLSVLRAVWFSPSIEASDAGEDWYRCDVIAVVDDATLGTLPPTMEGALGGDGLDSLGLCGTAAPGADGFRRIACGLEHTWRAIDVVDLGSSYPGEDAAAAAGSAQCQSAAGELAADVLDYEWGYEWPTQEQWDAGQTYGLCWAPA